MDIQFILSGVEMNILLAGLLYILTRIFPTAAPTLSKVAFFNVILAVTNLIPAWKFDGERLLSIIAGTESVNHMSVRWVRSKEYRKKIKQEGTTQLTLALAFSLLADAALCGIIIAEFFCTTDSVAQTVIIRRYR